jgi:hypothetical protein
LLTAQIEFATQACNAVAAGHKAFAANSGCTRNVP